MNKQNGFLDKAITAEHERNGLAVSARELTKVYQRGREQIRALDKVTFEVQRGEFAAIVGPSGAGKRRC